MGKALTENQKLSLNSVLTTLVLLITIFVFVRPSLVFSSDLEPLQAQQALNTTSINNVERILTVREIRGISKEIAVMEHNKENPTPADPWTRREAVDLSDLKTDLSVLQSRLDELAARRTAANEQANGN